MEWTTLWDRFLSLNFPPQMTKHVKEKYVSASSWHTFFQSIKDDRCKYWTDWVIPLFHVLAKGFHIRGTSWRMSFQPVAEVDIEETSKLKSLKPNYTGVRLFGGSTRKYMQSL